MHASKQIMVSKGSIQWETSQTDGLRTQTRSFAMVQYERNESILTGRVSVSKQILFMLVEYCWRRCSTQPYGGFASRDVIGSTIFRGRVHCPENTRRSFYLQSLCTYRYIPSTSSMGGLPLFIAACSRCHVFETLLGCLYLEFRRTITKEHLATCSLT